MLSDNRQRLAHLAHLLRRAGFGPAPAKFAEYESIGFDASVERLLDPEATPDDESLDQAFDELVPDPEQRGLAPVSWLYRMAHSPRPLEEKLAFFWHDHFATSVQKVKSEPLMTRQVDIFRRLDLGRFEDLTIEVSRDPAMLL